jgi:galactonate dehydratase
MFTRWQFKPLLASGSIDIVQPDISHCGGIWELRKIAAMAEAFDVAVAPHCPLGPNHAGRLAPTRLLHAQRLYQEQSLGIHYHEGSDLLDYLDDPAAFRYENGYVLRTDAPGLGIQINEAKVREAAQTGHQWRNPLWRNADGCVTEW